MSGINIEKIPYDADVPMVDVMGGNSRIEAKILDHGFVALIDTMPRFVPKGQTADHAIPQAARVSYGEGTKKVSENRGLIRYLMRHRHTTPFEMVETKWHCKMPIFVARQWIRHRTANVNEYSGRYSVMPDEFYRPKIDDVKVQSKSNKQGGGETLDSATAQEFLNHLDKLTGESYRTYTEFLDKGVAREQARIILPSSNYTEWYWKIDLHNLFHFLGLRMDSHAQKEIRDYADAMGEMTKEIAPIAYEAFEDYRLNSVSLSSLEQKVLQKVVDSRRNVSDVASELITNKRERAECVDKVERIVHN